MLMINNLPPKNRTPPTQCPHAQNDFCIISTVRMHAGPHRKHMNTFYGPAHYITACKRKPGPKEEASRTDCGPWGSAAEVSIHRYIPCFGLSIRNWMRRRRYVERMIGSGRYSVMKGNTRRFFNQCATGTISMLTLCWLLNWGDRARMSLPQIQWCSVPNIICYSPCWK